MTALLLGKLSSILSEKVNIKHIEKKETYKATRHEMEMQKRSLERIFTHWSERAELNWKYTCLNQGQDAGRHFVRIDNASETGNFAQDCASLGR